MTPPRPHPGHKRRWHKTVGHYLKIAGRGYVGSHKTTRTRYNRIDRHATKIALDKQIDAR